MIVNGIELLKMIKNGEIKPRQELIRQTEHLEKVYLDFNLDLVWWNNKLAMRSHSIMNYDFEIVEFKKQLPEKLEHARDGFGDFISPEACIAQQELKINEIIDYLNCKEEKE